MASQVSQGAVLYMDETGGTRGSTTIGQVSAISGPGPSAEKIDVTALSDTYKQYLRGIYDGGDMTFDIFYDATQTGAAAPYHDDITAAMLSGTLQEFRIDFSDGGNSVDFDGYITGFEISHGVDEALTASVSVGLTGAIVFPT